MITNEQLATAQGLLAALGANTEYATKENFELFLKRAGFRPADDEYEGDDPLEIAKRHILNFVERETIKQKNSDSKVTSL